MTATLDPWLREILRCPACRGELADRYEADGFYLDCVGVPGGTPSCGRRYRIEDGIPVLLVDEAIPSPA